MKCVAMVLTLVIAGAAITAALGEPTTQELISQARAALVDAFASSESLGEAPILGRMIAIGPRLWAASASARKEFKAETIETFALVSRDTVAKWRLVPIKLAALPESAQEIAAESTGVPVLTGTITRRSGEVLPAMVLPQVEPTAFPFSIRRPSEAEIAFIQSVAPFQLSEPLFVLESGPHAFFCNVGSDGKGNGKLIFVEML